MVIFHQVYLTGPDIPPAGDEDNQQQYKQFRIQAGGFHQADGHIQDSSYRKTEDAHRIHSGVTDYGDKTQDRIYLHHGVGWQTEGFRYRIFCRLQ